ncbi:hypothetical protein R6Q57_013320 [Mikania cordata]
MQSFKSKEYVKETFAWMHYYWYLTNDGIEFLRTYLNLPSDIVPATLKKSAKPLGRPMGGPPGDRFRGPPRFEGDRPRFGDRDGYRGGPRGPPGEFGRDKGGAPADYQPAFNSINQFQQDVADIRSLLSILTDDRNESSEFRKVVLAWMKTHGKQPVDTSGSSGGVFSGSGGGPDREEVLSDDEKSTQVLMKMILVELAAWLKKARLRREALEALAGRSRVLKRSEMKRRHEAVLHRSKR